MRKRVKAGEPCPSGGEVHAKKVKCKACQRERHKRYWKSEGYTQRVKTKYQPERRRSLRARAWNALNGLIYKGGWPKASTKLCVDCGAQAQVWDHRDYHKPFDVEAVCKSCNAKRGPARGVDEYLLI